MRHPDLIRPRRRRPPRPMLRCRPQRPSEPVGRVPRGRPSERLVHLNEYGACPGEDRPAEGDQQAGEGLRLLQQRPTARQRSEREAVPTVEDARQGEASQPLDAAVRLDDSDPGLERHGTTTGRHGEVQALLDGDDAGRAGCCGERVPRSCSSSPTSAPPLCCSPSSSGSTRAWLSMGVYLIVKGLKPSPLTLK